MSDIPTWHQRAMAHPDHQSGMISEGMIRARMCEEIEDLRAEIERLRAALALEESGFALKRSQVEKLRAKIDELMRSHEMCANAMRAESDRADEAWAEVEKQRAENERLREALRDIERGDYSDPMCVRTPEQRAREALEGKP